MCEYLDMLEKRGEKRGERRRDAKWRKLILKLNEEGKNSLIIDAVADKKVFNKLYRKYILQ